MMANGLYTIDCENGSYDPMIPTIRVPFNAILTLHLSLLLFYIFFFFFLWQFIMDRRLASHMTIYVLGIHASQASTHFILYMQPTSI